MGMTQWSALAASCGLSFAVVVLIGVPMGRAKREEEVYSASLGIMIFGCVKMVLVECGWGFAALFGVGTGLSIQLVLMLGGFFFFHQLRETQLPLSSGSFVLNCGMLLCTGVGQTGWRREETGGVPGVYVIGEALHFALLILSVLWMEEESSQTAAGRWAAAAAVVLVLKGAGTWLLSAFCGDESAFAALLLMTLGVSGLLCEFVCAVERARTLSSTGFAVGMAAAFCVGSLMG